MMAVGGHDLPPIPLAAPAGDAGDGEQGREQVLGNVQHFIYQARVEVHIGAHDLVGAGDPVEYVGGQPGNGFQQVQLGKEPRFLRQGAGGALQGHSRGSERV